MWFRDPSRTGEKRSAVGHRLPRKRIPVSGGESLILIQVTSDGWGEMGHTNELDIASPEGLREDQSPSKFGLGSQYQDTWDPDPRDEFENESKGMARYEPPSSSMCAGPGPLKYRVGECPERQLM